MERGSDTTKAERTPDDDLIREEEAVAARDAAHIGGIAGDEDLDPAIRPVYEGGGGEAEGFEQAEADLVENASHGDGRGDPLGDAFTGEVESDAAGVAYGEPDEVDTTEVVRDTGPAGTSPGDDAGEGPGIAADR